MSLLACFLALGSGCSGLWSFSCAASELEGEAEEPQNWPYFLRTVWDPREVSKPNSTGQNPGGRRETLVCFLLELGSVKGLDENPGIWFICWEEVEQGRGARMGSSLKEGC